MGFGFDTTVRNNDKTEPKAEQEKWFRMGHAKLHNGELTADSPHAPSSSIINHMLYLCHLKDSEIGITMALL